MSGLGLAPESNLANLWLRGVFSPYVLCHCPELQDLKPAFLCYTKK